MKKAIIFILSFCLIFSALITSSFAANQEMLKIEIDLDKDELNWAAQTEILVTAHGVFPADVTDDKDMLIISYWQLPSGYFRVGIKTVNAIGLLVRTDLPHDKVASKKLSIIISKADGKWKMTANGVEINNINWNTDSTVKTTDDISDGTNYDFKTDSKPTKDIGFLKNAPAKVDVTTTLSVIQINVKSMSGVWLYVAPASSAKASSKVSSKIASLAQSSLTESSSFENSSSMEASSTLSEISSAVSSESSESISKNESIPPKRSNLLPIVIAVILVLAAAAASIFLIRKNIKK